MANNKEKPITFLKDIGNVVARDPSSSDVIFYGKFLTSTSTEITVNSTDITGTNGVLLMQNKTGKRVNINFVITDWDIKAISMLEGNKIQQSMYDIFEINSPVAIDAAGKGILNKTAIGKVYVVTPDGLELNISPNADNTIDLNNYGVSETCVKTTYLYSAKSDAVRIGADATPMIVEVDMVGKITNTNKGDCGKVTVRIPRLQLDGGYNISTNSDGTATEIAVSGVALAQDGQICGEGMTYGYIINTPDDFIDQPIIEIIASPSPVELSVGETENISVVGDPGGLYDMIGIMNSECTFASDNPSVATVDNNGEITAVSSGSAIVTVTHKGFSDNIDIHVI